MNDIVSQNDMPNVSRGDIVPMADLPHHAEPSPFPVDQYVDNHVKDFTPDKQVEQRNGFTQFFSNIADPWMATGYTAASAINRGIANMADTFDVLTKYIQRETGMERGGLFEKAAEEYNRNAGYWKDRADKVGVGFLEELVGEAVGGAVPGIVDFALKVASGFTIPAVTGAEKAKEHDQDPFIGSLIEAAKTGTLYGVFKMIQPFSRYIQATMMGGTFALESAMEAPEGQKIKEAAKGLGTGLLFSSLSSPGGVKVRDLYPEIGRSVPEFRKEIEETRIEPEPTSQAEIKGVGAKAPSAKGETAPDIDQLTQSLENLPKTTTFNDRMKFSEQATAIYKGALAAPRNAFEKVKAIGASVWDWYKNSEVKFTNFDKVFMEHLGGIDVSGLKTQKWAEQIISTVSREKREAMANYVAAGGDVAKLREWADKSQDPAIKKGYESALDLSDEEKTFAENIRQYYSAKLDKAIEAEMIDHGVSDYVNQVLKKKDPMTGRIMAESNAGLFRANPAFLKKRIFEHFFDGEQEGYTYEKDIGKLITIYENSFNKAILTRKFVKDLPSQDAADGKPLAIVSGSGVELPGGEKPSESYLIKPRTIKDEDYGLYREIPHSALRGYKWVGKDAEGKPIFLQGDLLIHKEGYKKLKNALAKSALQENAVTAAILKGSGELKNTLLSISPFHQVTEIEHAIGHKVNPWGTHALDTEDPVQRELINHGLKVYGGDSASLFSEGLFGSGLIEKIPLLGPASHKYKEYLFKKKIPEIKMNMAMDAFERNQARYPELNRDQLLKLSADQANHAFGELNYKAMGRNPTLQDVFRLAALAPDFLEARAGFALQALKPYGKEQAAALIRLAAYNFIGARILGAIIGDEADRLANDPIDYAAYTMKHPFGFVYDGKEYSIRTVPGDIYHLITDLRSFSYHRLNPATVRPAIEGLTGRDAWGRKKDVGEQISDYVTGFAPIPIQGLFNARDYTLYQSMLQSIGVTSWNAPSDAEIAIMDLHKEQAEQRKEIQKQVEKAIGPEATKELRRMQKMFTIRGQQ